MTQSSPFLLHAAFIHYHEQFIDGFFVIRHSILLKFLYFSIFLQQFYLYRA